MRTRHARQIRKGILLAREYAQSFWSGEPSGRWLGIIWEIDGGTIHYPKLTIQAFEQETNNLRKNSPWLP